MYKNALTIKPKGLGKVVVNCTSSRITYRPPSKFIYSPQLVLIGLFKTAVLAVDNKVILSPNKKREKEGVWILRIGI